VKRIVVLASGGGTNFQAIVDAVAAGTLNVDVGLLITDRPDIPVLGRAHAAAVPSQVLDRREHGARLSDAILAAVPAGTELIVLAGFLSILEGAILTHYGNRIINLHPSLLPRHGGAGMYGMRVHQAVLEAGDTESGCTVHFVDAGTDTGPVILQRKLAVAPTDTPATLQARVAVLEHDAIVAGIRNALEHRR
jgi:phosphoribosylglycinamide formyltransferase-1